MKKAIYLLVFVLGITTNVFSKGYYILTCINHTTGDSITQIGIGGSSSINLTIESGDSLTLFVYLYDFGTYFLQPTSQWYLDGDSIDGSFGSNPLNVIAPSSGIISAQVFTLTMQFIFSSPTGLIEQNNNNSHLKIYPNLTNTSLNIQINHAEPGDIKVGIYDLNGKLLKESDFKNVFGEFVINENVEGFDKGFYFIRVKTPSELFSERFIKL